MERRPTRPTRVPARPSEQPGEATVEPAAETARSIRATSGGLGAGPASGHARRAARPAANGSSSGIASKRVAAAAAAAGAAAAGGASNAAISIPDPNPGRGAASSLTAGAGSALAASATSVVYPPTAEPRTSEITAAALAPAAEPDAEVTAASSVQPSGMAVVPPVAEPIGITAAAAVDAPSSSGAAAAASAVGAAIAATNAAMAAHRLEAAAGVASGVPAAPGPPPVAIQGYRRAPARYSPNIIRAPRSEADAGEGHLPAAGSAAPAVEPALAAADDPNGRYMRRDAPASTDGRLGPVARAAGSVDFPSDGRTLPAPLFSNEGIFRQAEARRRRRLPGPLGAAAATIFGAGTALGHNRGSERPDRPTLLDDPSEVMLATVSPDFDPRRSPGRQTHHRLTGAILAAVTLVFAVAAVGLTAALPPSPRDPATTASSGTSPNLAAVDPSSRPDDTATVPAAEDTSVLPSGMMIGDDPLPPGATRKPTKPVPARTPAPTTIATVSGTIGPSPAEPVASTPTLPPSAGPSPSPTRTPTPTPSQTATPTLVPTPTPTPTPIPTPTPTPAMFTLVYSVAPPAVAPGNGLFYVASLPGASCRLHRLPVAGDNVSRSSNAFPTDSSGWAYISWGASWPATSTAVTATFYGYCTAAAPDSRTAKSDNVSVQWPPKASPTPSAF